MARRDEGLLEGKDPIVWVAASSKPAFRLDSAEARKARISHFKRLTAIARSHPELLEDLAQQALQNAGNVRTFGMLAGALTNAGTSDAVNAAAALMEAELPEPAQSRLIASLGGAKPMTEKALAVISGAMDAADPLPGAELAAGNAARTLEEQGEEDPAGTLVDQLIRRYKEAQLLTERVMLLSALGNTASGEILPLIEVALTDVDGRIQAAATSALRFVPGPGADRLLERQLAHPNIGLRAHAVRAAGSRSPSHWRPRLEAARSGAPESLVAVIDKVLRVWLTNTSEPIARR